MTVHPAGDVCVVLLDIEGTITPIEFVHDVLFPYARTHAKSYLTSHFDAPEVQADIGKLREEHEIDQQQGLDPPKLCDGSRDEQINAVVSYVDWLIDRDRKSTGLKSLQGKIWEEGYADGALRAPLYPDVMSACERWGRAGLRMAIFSSGSVAAQKLLIAHTDAGDLTTFIDAYFDTTTGPKTASKSYRAIADSLRALPEELLFISDVVAELNAAKAAGLTTLLCIRPGNPPQPPTDHQQIHSFDEIKSEPPAVAGG